MSAIEIASTIKLSYKRLINEGGPVDDDEEKEEKEEKAEKVKVYWRVRRWRWSRIRKLVGKRRTKVRIPGLRRLLKRKDKVMSALRVSWSNVFRRLKEGQPYMGDLFAGNYLFMQVTPSALKSANKPYMGHGLHGLHGFASKTSLGKIA